MDVIEIPRDDRALFDRFQSLRIAIWDADTEYPTVSGLDEGWVRFSEEHSDIRCFAFAAVDGDEWLGAAWADEELLENRDIVSFEIVVDPAHRRRGVGTALFRAIEELARSHGRTSLLTEANAPYDGETIFSPGTAFAEHHGLERKHLELHQVIEFPLPEADLDRIAAEIAPKHADYRLIQWDDVCPDEWIEQYCELASMSGSEVPLGELEIEPEKWTPERMREVEQRRLRQGRFGATTVAVAPDGRLAAYTDMYGTAGMPGVLYQNITLVRPEHRGHRLGMAIKLVNLRALQTRVDGKAVLHTWNAPDNRPMIAVNESLGFRPVENLCEYQRNL